MFSDSVSVDEFVPSPVASASTFAACARPKNVPFLVLFLCFELSGPWSLEFLSLVGGVVIVSVKFTAKYVGGW